MSGNSTDSQDQYQEEVLQQSQIREAEQEQQAEVANKRVQEKGIQAMQRSVRSVATPTQPKKSTLGG